LNLNTVHFFDLKQKMQGCTRCQRCQSVPYVLFRQPVADLGFATLAIDAMTHQPARQIITNPNSSVEPVTIGPLLREAVEIVLHIGNSLDAPRPA
jgi:hypothetical protein